MASGLSEKSRTLAVAHLLRHLSDVRALRRNPIVGHLFPSVGRPRRSEADREALERVRKMVRDAAVALRNDAFDATAVHAERQYTIVLRCDLDGELHQTVAGDLGLSLSQFYRERRAAREAIARHLSASMLATMRSPPAAFADFDIFEYEVSHARALHEAGSYDEAAAEARVLIDATESRKRRLQLYCMLANFFIDGIRYSDAYLAVQAARECYAALEMTDEADAASMRGSLEATTARLLWMNGDDARAIEANGRAIAAFRSDCARGGSDAGAQLTSVLLEACRELLGAGRFSEARLLIDEARVALSDAAVSSPKLVTEYLVLLGFVQQTSVDTIEGAFSTFCSSLETARVHRFGRQAIHAMAGLSLQAEFHGDFRSAASYIRRAISLSRSALTPYDRRDFFLRVLELDAKSEEPQAAISNAATIRESFPAGSPGWNLANLYTATASLSLNDAVPARMLSKSVADGTKAIGMLRTYGNAMCIYARANAMLGDRRSAIDAVERSVDTLERYGSPFNLFQAYEASAYISGNRAHAATVRELHDSTFKKLRLGGCSPGLVEIGSI